jgi:hypothetical protein
MATISVKLGYGGPLSMVIYPLIAGSAPPSKRCEVRKVRVKQWYSAEGQSDDLTI